MPNSTTSPNMGLVLPVPSADPGPEYANLLYNAIGGSPTSPPNQAGNSVDAHNHTPGFGVQIPPSGLDINSNLPFNSNSAVGLYTVNFTPPLVQPAAVAPNLGCLYVFGNELWYNDENNNQVQITNNGAVNFTSSVIPGMTAPASLVYIGSPAFKFVFQSAALTPANVDVASVILRNLAANSKGLTLQPPAAMGADYSLTLPSLPGVQSFLTVSAVGVIAPYASVNSGISNSNIAPVNSQISASSGSFSTTNAFPTAVTNLSVTITTIGKPVWVGLIADGSGIQSYVGSLRTGGLSTLALFFILRGASVLSQSPVAMQTGAPTLGTLLQYVPVTTVGILDFPIAGTYTYSIQAQADGVGSAVVQYAKLVAYELK